MTLFLLCMFAYLHGTIPTAHLMIRFLTGRFAWHLPVVGVLEVYDLAGQWAATMVIMDEIAKGVVAVILAYVFYPEWPGLQALVLLSALLGSARTPWFSGRGTRGVLLLAAGGAIIEPRVTLIVALIAALFLVLSHFERELAEHWVWAIPVVLWLIEGVSRFYGILGLLAALALYMRYRAAPDDRLVPWLGAGGRVALLPLGRANAARCGHHAGELLMLRHRHHLRLPATWAISLHLYDVFCEDPQAAYDLLRSALDGAIRPRSSYRVQPSLNIAGPEGQRLAERLWSTDNVPGVEGVVQGVATLWASTRESWVAEDLRSLEMDVEALRVGAVIQEVVVSTWAGVAYSANPITGRAEEILCLTTSDGVTPNDGAEPIRWVRRDAKWLEQPSNQAMPLDLVDQITATTRAVAEARGAPIALEWSCDGRRLYWLGMRLLQLSPTLVEAPQPE